jgi:hypothetical protein
MKMRFTHKEATLAAGIVVAIIIMLTLWLQPVSAEPGELSRKRIPAVTKPAAKAVTEKAFMILQQTLR